MDISFYNTKSRSVETFSPSPLHEKSVSMYHCGPTVYGRVHLGNLRSFVLADLVRRVFEYEGTLEVDQVMNITDVDDKTIRGAREAGMTLKAFTRMHEESFLKDLEAMNIKRPKKITRATEEKYIKEMIALIEKLRDKGIAYTTEDGVYFSVKKFESYGKMAQISLSSHTEERILNDTYDKEEAHDFALWKFYKPEDGDVVWEPSFGKGRPGWHIECSAMSMKELGETIDIHTGGIDLLFPHHTNEIAQSEGATGKEFVRYFVHGEFVTMGEKMSKSLGNTLTLKDLEEKNIHPLAYRYLLLQTHYRTKIQFSWEALAASWTALKKLAGLYKSGPTVHSTHFQLFKQDLDTPAVLATLWSLLKSPHETTETRESYVREVNDMLGLGLDKIAQLLRIENPEVLALLNNREEARKQKDFALSDKIRDEIQNLGFGIEDTPEGPRAYRL